jgi:hypothetical protein
MCFSFLAVKANGMAKGPKIPPTKTQKTRFKLRFRAIEAQIAMLTRATMNIRLIIFIYSIRIDSVNLTAR